MNLRDYFENTKGLGVLATSSKDGRVDAAVYARPHSMDDGTVAFIMPDKLTHANLRENPHAAFLFVEKGPGYKGKRLFLTRTREEEDSPLLYELRRRCYSPDKEELEGARYLVFFTIDKELPLIGAVEKE